MNMKKMLTIYAALIIVFVGAIALMNILPDGEIPEALAIQKQGDKVATVSSVSAYHIAGDGNTIYAGAFAHDPNAQFVAYFVNAEGNLVGATVDIYEASSTTPFARVAGFTTTGVAHSAGWCGGTTTFVTLDNQDLVPHSMADSGVSFVVIDDGAGTAAWAEVDESTDGAAGVGGVLELNSTAMNGNLTTAIAAATGQPYLSGTTFPVGSKVFLMKKVGSIYLGDANVTRESDSGLFAFRGAGPALVVLDPVGAASGATLFSVTGGYK